MILLSLAAMMAAGPEVTVTVESPRGEVGYQAGALGYDAIMARDYQTAERQLLAADGAQRQDAAWMINYAQVLFRTGRPVEAERVLRDAARLEDGELILSDGRIMMSRDAAYAALQKIRASRLSSR